MLLANPYVLLGALLGALGIFASGAGLGYKYATGQQARLLADAVVEAAEKGKAQAKTETQASLEQVKKQAAVAAAATQRRHTLEMELERDENARKCRVSDATLRVLRDGVVAANAPAPVTGGVDGAMPGISKSGGANRSRFGAEYSGGFGRLWRLPADAPGADRVD